MPQAMGRVLEIKDNIVTIELTQSDQLQYLVSNGEVGLLYDDGRHITAAQQHKIYALLGEIDRWAGNYLPELTKTQMKEQYALYSGIYDGFSLANCSETVATNFIEYLIDFCLAWNVPFLTRTLDEVQGQYGWERTCLKYKKCCICGNHADVAHVHAVGIGRDRNHIKHIGNQVMPLCRTHHNQQHNIGIYSFMAKYHIKGVRVTPDVAAMLRLGDWRTEPGDPITLTEDQNEEI
ncbi:hypothetical protein FIV11_14110 [Lactiplantibacillus plantarum]|uniref:putative HNHc nuclease n=1 Tax=Lactiplantibacillus plantarum TaxID=1590 RepID=UPI0026521AF8|nr:putative HNHc nuclease [Lactiplantibacillus plantarum]MDN7062843.1 hypothetical protein [Lactiplantibacillus plantarum]